MKHSDYIDRKGKFVIGLDIIDNGPQYAQAVMGEVVVTRAECLHHAGVIEYHCYSKHFRKIPFGEIIPTYKITVHTTYDDDEQVITLEFTETQDPAETLNLATATQHERGTNEGEADQLRARQTVAAVIGKLTDDVLDVTVEEALPGTVQALVRESYAPGGEQWRTVPLSFEDWQICIGEPHDD